MVMLATGERGKPENRGLTVRVPLTSNGCKNYRKLIELRPTRNTRKQLILFALMLMTLASWLALPGNRRSDASRVLADSSSPSVSLAKPDKTTQVRVNEAYGRLPLCFEVNQGQLAPDVKFAYHGRHRALYLTQSAALLEFRTPRRTVRDNASLALRIESDQKQIGT